MNILIKRNRVCAEAIEGTLMIEGLRVCDTAECRRAPLPDGEYVIRVQYMRPYLKRMMVLYPKQADGCYPTDGRLPVYDPVTGQWSYRWPDWRLPREYEAGINTLMPFCLPMLKPGNGVHGRTDGSIIVGQLIGGGAMLHPVKTYERIWNRVRQAVHRGKEVHLTIR